MVGIRSLVFRTQTGAIVQVWLDETTRPDSADQYETVNLPSVRPGAPGQQEDRQDAGRQGEVNAAHCRRATRSSHAPVSFHSADLAPHREACEINCGTDRSWQFPRLMLRVACWPSRQRLRCEQQEQKHVE
jgi:hypothetical protein